MKAKITTRQDKRANMATVYADGVCVAIMERNFSTGNWMYNASPPDDFRPRFFPTGTTSITQAARIAAHARSVWVPSQQAA